MEFYIHSIAPKKQVELVLGSFFIKTVEHGADLAARVYFEQVDHLIIHSQDLNPIFYNLRSGFAGSVLQKFSNFRLRLTIVGDYSQFTSRSLQNFIFESNQHKQTRFVKNLEEAIIPEHFYL